MLNTKKLDEGSIIVTKECLRATVEGPFFPEWEFKTLIGVSRDTVRAVMEAWPEQTVDDDKFTCAVANSLNNLMGYPHGHMEAWGQYISVGPEQVQVTIERLLRAGL